MRTLLPASLSSNLVVIDRSPRIVVVDIDERSLQEVARWPWPRDVMARIVRTLFETYQVAIVGFDVVFAEADYSSGIRSLDALAREQMKGVPEFREIYQRLRPALDNDGQFAEAIKGRLVVLGYYLSSEEGAKRIATIPPPVLPKGTFSGRNISFTTWDGYGGNLAAFTQNAASAGHFNPVVDFDGVVRRVPIIAQLDGAYYEALSLAVVRARTKTSTAPVTCSRSQLGRYVTKQKPRSPTSSASAATPPPWRK